MAIILPAGLFFYFLFAELLPLNTYREAVKLLEQGEYEQACQSLKEVEDHETVSQRRYDFATECIDAKKYDAAYALLKNWNYKDSREKQESFVSEYAKELFSKAEVGTTVLFGTYEQNNDESDGKEPIEWIVLAKEKDKVLMISKYGLDAKNYAKYSSEAKNGWAQSPIRGWLNDDFLNQSFGKAERKRIQKTKVPADANPQCDTKQGNASKDYVFLLSAKEAETYFSSNEERVCDATVYATANGVYTKKGKKPCQWWLRTLGNDREMAAVVRSSGEIAYSGNSVRSDEYAVRPALWVKL